MTNKNSKIYFLKGYTLIEILITVSLSVILFGLGLASFISFNRNQTINNAGKKIIEELKYTQSLTLNQQKPTSGCTTLNGYNFTITDQNLGDYSITAICTPDCTGDDCTNKTGIIGLLLSGITNVSFRILTGGITTTPLGTVYFSLTKNSLTKYVRVCSGGDITFTQTLPSCD